ncbi:MAG: ChaN family lipoprotein [Patescibacteria group bacterium]
MPGYSPEIYSFETELEPKESRFYEKLKHLTVWTCEQLDAAREESFGADLVERTEYVRDFDEEFSQFDRVVSRPEFLAKARQARLVFGGDVHDLEKATENLIQVLEHISEPNLVIGVECIGIDKQDIVDDYLAGKISEEEFLEESGLLEFIPQQARSYLRIFQRAKAVGLKVLALDSAPFGARCLSEEKKLEKRDEAAAEIIIQELEKDPHSRMYVIFGQAHLAKRHLPGRIKEKLPEALQLIFVQDIESLYNQALEKFGQVPLIAGVAEVEKNKFAILDTSPLEIRYERLKNQYRLRESEREAVDSTLEEFFPYLLDFLARNFNLDLEKLCFYQEEGKCEITFKELFENVDIGYDDKDLEKKLSPKEREKLKKKKALGFIKEDTPYLVIRRGGGFQEFVRATMEIIFEALQKTKLRKPGSEDGALIYLGTKMAKPDLKPETEIDKEGEELWRKLISGEIEAEII